MASVPSNRALGETPRVWAKLESFNPGGSAKDRTARALGAHIHPVEEPDPETGDWLTARRALVGRLVLAVVNFPPRQIGPFRSEVLTLGFADANGAVLLAVPDRDVAPGARLH